MGERARFGSRTWLLGFVLAVGFLRTGAVAQAAAVPAAPAYDVVSVKPDKSSSGMMRVRFGDVTFSAENLTLKGLLSMAYGVREDLIFGSPGWADADHFDVEAKVLDGDAKALAKLTNEQREEMLQAALKDRFQVQAHPETRTLPVYELMPAKGGLKMKVATPGDAYANGIKGFDGVSHAGMMSFGPGKLIGQGITMTQLVDNLAVRLQRTVIDKTGLTGNFEITLMWADDSGPRGGGAPDNGANADAGPSIFTAVQEQLGLRLQATKGPVKVLVVDKAEKPAEN